MQFHQTRLANGLEIVAECNPTAHTASLGYFVKTGARDETGEIAGVSHFLEHMVFKGTQRRSAEEVNLEFDRMGADYNAYTSEETTVYYASILPEFQDRTVELLGDIIRPALREEDFDSEKKVILEEILMYEDQPPFGADEKCRAVYFGEHPLSHSVLGTNHTVGELRVDQMRDYWRTRYSPGNIALIAAGKIDFDELVKTAERVCGGWEPVLTERRRPTASPHSRFEILHKEQATQEYVLSMSPAPSAVDPLRYAAKVTALILGDDAGSRLYWELVDPGLAEHCSLHYYGYEDAGILMTYLCCEPDDAAANWERVSRIYREAVEKGVTAEELRQVQSKFASRIVLSGERPRGRLFSIGNHWLYRKEYRSIHDDLQAVRQVTLADCRAVLDRYPLTTATTMAVGPLQQFSGSN